MQDHIKTSRVRVQRVDPAEAVNALAVRHSRQQQWQVTGRATR